MKFILIASPFILFTACQNQSAETGNVSVQDSTANVHDSLVLTESTIYVQDSSDYSADFLHELSNVTTDNIQLIDELLIVNTTDTIEFPQYPVFGTNTVLTGRTDDLAIAVTVERINQTTIGYKLEMVEFGQASFNKSGKATLSPYFYLGSEIDENSFTGMSYPCFEFADHSDSCMTIIRVGKEEESGPLLGKLISDCNGAVRPVNLDDFNTLHEK